MSNQGLSGQGLLMIVVGVWVILRTVTKDGSSRTLVDHILGKPAGNQQTSSSDPLAIQGYNLGPVSDVNSWIGKNVFGNPLSIPKYNLGPVTTVNNAIGGFFTKTVPHAIGSLVP